MQTHSQLPDSAFELAFETLTFDPTLFTHEAHLRLAWIHITKYGEETAIQTISHQLAAFVASVGADDKYNQTLTTAAIKAVSHFIKKSNAITFQEFILEFPRLRSNFKDLMNAHYGIDIFNSERAKKEFLEPDLLPFD